MRTERTNDEIAVHVIDHGPGIRVEDHARLFEPFWQSDDSDARTVGGSGLGLAISQAIVQRHQGEIEVQSELGAGADFIVRLPLHRANALSTATQLTEPTNNRPSGGAA